MARQTYIVTLDASDPAIDLDALKEFIKTSPHIDNWWNHIPFVFLVSTELSAGGLSDLLRRYTKDARLLVMAVDPGESDGWLAERSWQWIRRHSASTRARSLLEKVSRHDDSSEV